MQVVWVSLGPGENGQDPLLRGDWRQWKGAGLSLLVSSCFFFWARSSIQTDSNRIKDKFSAMFSLVCTAVIEEIHGIACNTKEQSGNTWRAGRHCSQPKWPIKGWELSQRFPVSRGSIFEFDRTFLPTCEMGDPSLQHCKGKMHYLCVGKSKRSLEPTITEVKSACDFSRLAKTV